MLHDRLRLMMEVDRDFPNSVGSQQSDRVLQERPSADGQHRLGSIGSQATEPSAQPGCEDQCFHETSYRRSGTRSPAGEAGCQPRFSMSASPRAIWQIAVVA